MSLTPCEKEFVLSNYKLYTAKEIMLSINKLRLKEKVPLIQLKNVENFIVVERRRNGESINEDEKETVLQPLPKKVRGNRTKKSRLDSLRQIYSDTSNDGLCEGFDTELPEESREIEDSQKERE